MKNKIENKVRFFALYWGVKCLRNGLLNDNIHTHKVDTSNCKGLSQQYLELKHLSHISDEDAIEVAKIIEPYFKFSSKETGFKTTVNREKKWVEVITNVFKVNIIFGWDHSPLEFTSFHEGRLDAACHNRVYKAYRKLQSLGYYVGEGVEIEYGWVKLREL